MAKPPPGETAKKGVARRDDEPTHEMGTHPELGDDSPEELTDQSVVPPEVLTGKGEFSGDTRIEPTPPARPEPKPAPAGRTAPDSKTPAAKSAAAAGDKTAAEVKLSSLFDDPQGFSGDTRIEPGPPARPDSKPAPGDRTESETKLPVARPFGSDRTESETKLPVARPFDGDKTAAEVKLAPGRPAPAEKTAAEVKLPSGKPVASDKTAPETKLSSLYGDPPAFAGNTRVEPAPPARESGSHKASSKESREAKEPKKAKEPEAPTGAFSSDTRVEAAPPARESKEHKAWRDSKEPPREPAKAKEPEEKEKEKEKRPPKGFFERTDPSASPQPPSEPSVENALPWQSGEAPFGATTPLPDIRDQLPPEEPSEPPEPAAPAEPPVPFEPWPDEPVFKEPPKRAATRDGLRRVSSPSVPAAESPPKKAPKPTRDAVPVTVANQETNVRAIPTSRDVAGQETRIKAAPTADERSSNRAGLAHQETTIKPAPEEPVRRRTGAHSAVRGDFPEAEPRRSGNVANASTVLKPIPEDVQKELGVEKPARRSGTRDAARRPAPIERPDPTPAHGFEPDPPQTEPDPEPEPEPEAPPAKPKPLPFVDKRPRSASSADLFESTGPEEGKPAGRLRSAKRADPRVSKVFQTLSHLKTMSEGNTKGLAIVGAVFALIVIVVIAVGALRGGDRPREDELRRAYPFGYAGARGPRGEQAPGAAELTFTFKMVAPCPQTAEPECLLYEYRKGAFEGRMLLRKTSDGWVRASDEGAPFLLVK